jgi:HEAT repeat protein
MRTIRICAFALIASNLLLAQQPTTPTAPPPNDTVQPSAAQTPAAPAAQAPAAVKPAQSPKEEAWEMLDSACAGDKTTDHAIAIRVMGLMPNDAKALALVEQGLDSDKPEIRAAAAAALGDMKARTSIPKLREVLDDKDPLVALAAANSLNLMRDRSAYAVYYAVLTRQRKAGKGLIASETAVLKDPKKMAEMGFEEGIGFIPFAGIGWGAVKAITKDDTSPVRAAAAKALAHDPDPSTTKALASAAEDKSWLVRVAALEALANREDSSVLHIVALHMSDEKSAVKYTAAATVLRLTAVKEGSAAAKLKKSAEKTNKS